MFDIISRMFPLHILSFKTCQDDDHAEAPDVETVPETRKDMEPIIKYETS